MAFKSISPRRLTASYCVALAVIAVLSIASHSMLAYGLRHSEGSAAIVNMTGRQRMLSQRIASLAAQYRLGDASARADMSSAIVAFETAHDFLIAASRRSSSSNPSARALQRLYFATAGSLDGRVRGFITDARRVAALTPDNPAFAGALTRVLVDSRATMPAQLDQVVSIEQAESERQIACLAHMQWGILLIVLLTLCVEAMVIFRPMVSRITAYTSDLVRLATTDPLTGAANRRSFMERCSAEVTRARRNGRPASMLMIDVDRFKAINDTHGHAAGDAVLKAVGAVLMDHLRATDICGRMGGEEFALMLCDTEPAAAALVAERLRVALSELRVRYREHDVALTVSIGVATLCEEVDGLETALRVADGLLYMAKTLGRNRVLSDVAAHSVIFAPAPKPAECVEHATEQS